MQFQLFFLTCKTKNALGVVFVNCEEQVVFKIICGVDQQRNSGGILNVGRQLERHCSMAATGSRTGWFLSSTELGFTFQMHCKPSLFSRL